MCQVPLTDNNTNEIIRPEIKLAALMSRELDVNIRANELKLFIMLHWNKIAPLAHAIHDKLKESEECSSSDQQ